MVKKVASCKAFLIIIPLLALGAVLLFYWLRTAHQEENKELLSSTRRSEAPADEEASAAGQQAEAGSPVAAPRGAANGPSPAAIEEHDLAADELISDFESRADVNTILMRAQRDLIVKAQDAAMRAWPAYSTVREELRGEVFAALRPETLSDEELITAAAELRRKFWDAGGCRAGSSYRYAFMARILLEYAHERSPGDLLMTDALVEAIQDANVIFARDEETKEKTYNEEFLTTVFGLRSKQFEQVRSEVEKGRTPTLEDFLRGFDLASLLQRHDKPAAKKVVQWLRANALAGGWGGESDLLAMFENALDDGMNFGANLYTVPHEKFPEEYRYVSRKLPSFRGPEERGASLCCEIVEEVVRGYKTGESR